MRSESRDKTERKKGFREEGRGGVGWFLLGPIKKPVSSSVSKSLLWHSRQLRKHLKAPEKPDNTSLVECRVPLGGRRDFAPCQRDTLRPPCVAISALSYVLNIECPSRANFEVQSRGDMPKSAGIFFLRSQATFANASPDNVVVVCRIRP